MELIISDKKSICLNMIVKNESAIIKDTLENLCSYLKFHFNNKPIQFKEFSFFKLKGLIPVL